MSKVLKDMPLMQKENDNIVLFYPHMPKLAEKYVCETLNSRWIGQGPKVELFEKNFGDKFCEGRKNVAVGAGTDAMHLAFLLSDIKQGDEVVTPVFTCTATNIPLLYQKAKPIFADVDRETLNINVTHVKELVNERTKAIVCVHYAGLPCDMDELQEVATKWNIPIIEDAAHAVGAKYKGKTVGSISDFTMFSFQAIKHITTGDGGMLSLKDNDLKAEADRLRWFGIDRQAKQGGIWANDITEIGYKYQMTDISAAMGLAALEEVDEVIDYRRQLFSEYERLLENAEGIKLIGANVKDREHSAWMCTVLIEERRMDLQKKLYEHGIESNQVHYRNDRYSIFGNRRDNLPNMDFVEDKYLVLPLHTKLSLEDVQRVCDCIKSGW